MRFSQRMGPIGGRSGRVRVWMLDRSPKLVGAGCQNRRDVGFEVVGVGTKGGIAGAEAFFGKVERRWVSLVSGRLCQEVTGLSQEGSYGDG